MINSLQVIKGKIASCRILIIIAYIRRWKYDNYNYQLVDNDNNYNYQGMRRSQSMFGLDSTTSGLEGGGISAPRWSDDLGLEVHH